MEASQDTLWGSWNFSGNTFAQSQNGSHKMKEQRRQKAQHKMNPSQFVSNKGCATRMHRPFQTVFPVPQRQKEAAHENHLEGRVVPGPAQFTEFQENSRTAQPPPAPVFAFDTRGHGTCGCVWWLCWRVRNHDTWASVWHVGKEPVKTDLHCCFLVLSQKHLGQSLKRSHSWTFCLALMLNFLLPHFFGWTFGTRRTAQYCILTTL